MIKNIKFLKSDVVLLQAIDYELPLLFEYKLDKIDKSILIDRKLKSLSLYNIVNKTSKIICNDCIITFIYDSNDTINITLKTEEG